jgi:hypothetical protein
MLRTLANEHIPNTIARMARSFSSATLMYPR